MIKWNLVKGVDEYGNREYPFWCLKRPKKAARETSLLGAMRSARVNYTKICVFYFNKKRSVIHFDFS